MSLLPKKRLKLGMGSFFRISFVCLTALAIALPALADEHARLAVGIPTYVAHSDSRSNAKGWNEGWFQNEGAFVDMTWPVHRFSKATTFRAGVTGGVFDNSVFSTSVFAGGVAEVETYATKDLAFSLGTYAGAITGYDDPISPAIAPYVATSYAVTDRLELGVRGFWLPAKTIAGASLAESDAYVAAITLGTRF